MAITVRQAVGRVDYNSEPLLSLVPSAGRCHYAQTKLVWLRCHRLPSLVFQTHWTTRSDQRRHYESRAI